jgi:predicted permease
MNIISIITPLILVALLGFICTKSKWLSREQLNTLSKFTFSISIPAFLFYQMAKADLSSQISVPLFAAFYLPVLTCYLITWLISYYFYPYFTEYRFEKSLHKNSAASAVFALSASYSNTVIVGLPVLLAAIGEQVISIVFLIVAFHSAVLFALTAVLSAESPAQSLDKKKVRHNYLYWFSFIKHTLNNPLIISILSGLAVNLLGITLPIFLQESLALIGKPAITLALFILGGSLAFYHVHQALKLISIACISKLILLPCLVFCTTHYIFELNPLTAIVLVILSACPTGVNAHLIAITHQQHQQAVAGTVVISTLLSTITIPLWLSFML